MDVAKYLAKKYKLIDEKITCTKGNIYSDYWFSQAFMYACVRGYNDIVKYLIKDFHLTENDDYGWYYFALEQAVEHNYLEFVIFLTNDLNILDKSKNIDVLCEHFRTSAINGHLEIVKYFREKYEISKMVISFTSDDIVKIILDNIEVYNYLKDHYII